MEASIIRLVIVLCAFLTFPLIAEALNPPDQHLNTANPVAAFPSTVDLWKPISVTLIQHTRENTKTIIVNITSPYCLQRRVKVFERNLGGDCDSMLWHTLSPVKRILGFSDTQTLLNYHKPIINYRTWGSFIIAVMERAITDPLIRKNRDDLELITQYKMALNFAMSSLFLPLIAKYKKFHQHTLWLHCQPSGVDCIMKKSLSKKMITLQANNMTNDIVVPIVNPEQWLLPVDNQSMITLFNATIYPELKDKLWYHNELFNKGDFIKYLNSFPVASIPVDAKIYPNSGSLFMHVLIKLEGKLEIMSKTELWKATVNYKRAIEHTALTYRLPKSFLISLDTKEVSTPTINDYKNVPIFPEWLDPMVEMVVHPHIWPLPSCIESNNGKNNLSIGDVSLPSVYCLQSSSDFVNLPKYCKESAEALRSFMANIFQAGYTNFSLNDDMKKRYRTLISYLAGLVENVKPPTNRKKIMQLGTYRIALELAVPSINLPLIAHYRELDTKVVWLVINSNDPLNPIIRSKRPRKIGKKKIILPLVNPRLWHLPVDKENPYSVLIPDLPANDPYAIMIKPLRSILRPGKWFTKAFTRNWNPLEHETRGLLFVNVLYRLSEGIAFHDTDERISHGASGELALIVKNYRTAIQSLAFFSHVPSNYIENEALKVTNEALKVIPLGS